MTENTTLANGSPVYPEHRELIPDGPRKGQQRDYVVLSQEERAKGFVRPVRSSYVHVGAPAIKNPLRDLTEEELARNPNRGYVKYEAYPESESPKIGRYWTQQQLDAVGKGCGVVTHMGRSIAETYARNPQFYSGTFCVGCKAHFPVGPDGEFVWDGTNERVGT